MFYNIINKIKIHIKLGNKLFKTTLIKSDFKILNIFIKLNIVIGVKQLNKNTYIVYLNSDHVFTNFKNLHKPSKPIKINLKNIIKINRKNTRIFFLTSSKGLLNNIEAEKQKIGGFLVLNII